jgi:hypothetical protein
LAFRQSAAFAAPAEDLVTQKPLSGLEEWALERDRAIAALQAELSRPSRAGNGG